MEYPELEERIRETYAEYYEGANIRQLYDTYKMAIRWASDRIDKQGVIAFVTNGSWIDGNADSGSSSVLGRGVQCSSRPAPAGESTDARGTFTP